MALSSRYARLKTRVEQLGNHLLPQIDPTGSYSDKDLDLTRSYCLLCHAEIEAYIEDIILEITSNAVTNWHNDKSIITPIVFHLAYTYRSEKREPPYSMVVLSFNLLKKYIEKNNGIKEDNLNGFCKPIGFQMDEVLKTTLSDFGKTRGEIAHTSFQTQQPIDPQTEKNRVLQILSGLALFDYELFAYSQTGVLKRTPIVTQWKKFSFVERIKILFTGKHIS